MTNTFLALKNKTILFAEDDEVMREQTAEILSMIFKKVYTARDGEEAYELYEDEKPDIIITDIKMPRKDGLKLIAQIRQKDYNTPIIVLTSFSEQEMLINAANLSVDGYLIKPIELARLTATIGKAMQRAQNNFGLIKLESNLFYNTGTQELYKNGLNIPLGIKEQELLVLLINKHDKTVTKHEIAKVLWPLDTVGESSIKNLILRIRKKIHPNFIISVRGIGYRLGTYGFNGNYSLDEKSK